MEYKIKTDDIKNRLREYEISGDITVQNIEKLVEAMKDCVANCDELVIHLSQVTSFDIAALQFFYSLKNSFIRDHKKLKVSCSLSDEASKLLSNCGVDDLAKVLSISED